VRRYEAWGPAGLEDQAHVARTHPLQTPDDIVDVLVRLRKQFPFWNRRSCAHG
jgi:hypothetical protein